MSRAIAGPSTEGKASSSKGLLVDNSTGGPSLPNLRRFERLSRDLGRSHSPGSVGSRERLRSIRVSGRPSFDAQELSYYEQPSPTAENAIFRAEQLKNRKLYNYVKIWRRNYILTLDGGGVRGYSQLIILKALMDKVADLERSLPDENEKIVESSFHPLSWEEDKSVKLRRDKSRSQVVSRRQTNGHANGANSKGKQVITNGHPDGNSSEGRQAEEESATSTESSSSAGPAFYPHHYFDWIAGTSTGGLNAIMLGRLRMSVDECLRDYELIAQRIFGHPRWFSYRFSPLFWFCDKYSADRLRDVIKDVVEEHLCEGEGYLFAMNKEMCRTVVVAMKKNIRNHEMAHLFRTYDHHRRRQNPVEDLPARRPNPMEQSSPADSSLIWEVARATSAAPTYFNTIKIGEDEFGDGGFGENNPSTRIFWEVSQMNHNIDAANTLSISIGTGVTRFTRFQNGPIKRVIGWLNATKKISTDCERGHTEMQRITNSGRKYKYYRFNVPERATEEQETRWQHLKTRGRRLFGHGGEPLDRGLGKIRLDEWKPRGIWRKESTQEEIARITTEYLNSPGVDNDLNEVAKAMVFHRRARAATPRWPVYALGIRYECPLVYERCPDETWTEESDLRRHLINDHEYATGTPEADRKLEQAVKAGKYFEHHH